LNIDLTAAWLAAFDPDLVAQCGQGGWIARFNQALRDRAVLGASGLPVSLVKQSELPEGEAYEAFIFRTGKVPTRENLHDFFNALLWLHMPRSKARLNALQAQAIAQQGIRARRGALRDYCTLLDENGLLLIAPETATQALHLRDWHALLARERQRWGADILVFPLGHALLEKLAQPYKAITAHCVIIEREKYEMCNIHAGFEAKVPGKPHGYCAVFDELLVECLAHADALNTAQLQPLPVLGIPGWWPANVSPDFYQDAQVFRPLR
jgi:hypothetical protein